MPGWKRSKECATLAKRPIEPLPPRRNPPGLPKIALARLPERPLISVVVPSYNQGAFIAETIESALAQDYRPIEIVIVDGASSDGTVPVLERYNGVEEVRWLSEPDSGVVEAVNKGFALARGEVIAIQSSDDFYMAGAFQAAVDALKANPECGLVFGDIVTVDRDGAELRATDQPAYSFEGFLALRLFIPQPSAFFRREALDVIGGWDERYFVADTEFWLRLLFRSTARKIDRKLAKRRMHDAQRDLQAGRIAASYKDMIRQSEDIGGSSRKLRRLANAGLHMASFKYKSTYAYFSSSLHLWRGLVRDPGQMKRWARTPLIIPGYLWARVAASRIKARLIGRRGAA
jgi:glycosyltransferase involved in cell wall biosynthesis